MGSITGLAHIGIMVKCMDTSVKFYQGTLGFSLTNEKTMGNGTKLAFLDKGTCLIELVQLGEPAPERPAGVVDHVAVEVVGIEELVDELKAKGVNFLGDIAVLPDLLGGVKNIFFVGPDGERLEFFEYTK